MPSGSTAFLFFAAIFWTAVLGAVRGSNPFDTAALFSREHRCHALRRLLVSILLLNAGPILWLLAVLRWLVPERSDTSAVAVAALAALSIFGFNRVFYAVVASNETSSAFYSDEELEGVCKQWPQRTRSFFAHLLPGVGFFIFFLSAAILTAWRT